MQKQEDEDRDKNQFIVGFKYSDIENTSVGVCLLISSLPGKAWRRHVKSQGLLCDSTSLL